MQTTKRWLTTAGWVLGWMVFAIAGACDADGAAGNGGDEFTYAGYALEASDGGFDESSETEAFENVDGADREEFFEAPGETDVADDPAVNPDTVVPDEPAGATRYVVRVLWGQPRLNPSVSAATAWNGTFTTDGAVILVRRLVRFEAATGDAVLPRTAADAVEVVSTTGPHWDGIVMDLILPAAAGDTAPTGTLAIELGALSLTYDFAELDGLMDVRTVDDAGNIVAVQAVQKRADACERGFLSGYFQRVAPRGGVFGGRWIDASGETTGRLAGIWGHRKNGRRVLFGVFRNADGTFGGVLKGTYTPYGVLSHGDPEAAGADDAALVDEPDPRPAGEFAARWVGRGRLHKGVIHGMFAAGEGGAPGSFEGRFARACREAPGAGIPDTPFGCEGAGCRPELPETENE